MGANLGGEAPAMEVDGGHERRNGLAQEVSRRERE